MAEIREVTNLPVVDASAFPELPDDFAGKNYIVFGSKWQHAEEETIAALVLTAAARRGKWEPISWSSIVDLLKGDMMRMITLGNNIGYYLHKVADSGDIELVKMGDDHYIIPTPVLAETLKACQVRYYEDAPVNDTPELDEEPVRNPKPDNIVARFLRWLLG